MSSLVHDDHEEETGFHEGASYKENTYEFIPAMDDEDTITLENVVYEPMEISDGEDVTEEEEEIIKKDLSTSTDSN